MEFKVFVGNEIPLSLRILTRRQGLMRYWLKEREYMTAVVAYENGIHVGWCGYLILEGNIVEVGTFVSREYRKCKLGSKLLDKTMRVLSLEMPCAQVRYGGSLHPQFHDTYIRTIKKHGLEPIRWF